MDKDELDKASSRTAEPELVPPSADAQYTLGGGICVDTQSCIKSSHLPFFSLPKVRFSFHWLVYKLSHLLYHWSTLVLHSITTATNAFIPKPTLTGVPSNPGSSSQTAEITEFLIGSTILFHKFWEGKMETATEKITKQKYRRLIITNLQVSSSLLNLSKTNWARTK